MLPEGGTLRVQRKRRKVSLSERDQSTKWEWSKNGGKLTWQSATNSKHENERRGKEEEGTRAREMFEEWGNSRSKIHRSINQTTVIRSDAPQEEIERYMICGVMQMNRGLKNHYTPLQSAARREDCKDKDPTNVIELYQNWLGTRGKGGGGSENKCSAMPCALHCYFSHLCFFSLWLLYHWWCCKANEMNALIVIFLPHHSCWRSHLLTAKKWLLSIL